MQVLASQLHILANKNAELPLFWPVNCIKIGGHVALLSDPTVYCPYCVGTLPILYTSYIRDLKIAVHGKWLTSRNSFVIKSKS